MPPRLWLWNLLMAAVAIRSIRDAPSLHADFDAADPELSEEDSKELDDLWDLAEAAASEKRKCKELEQEYLKNGASPLWPKLAKEASVFCYDDDPQTSISATNVLTGLRCSKVYISGLLPAAVDLIEKKQENCLQRTVEVMNISEGNKDNTSHSCKEDLLKSESWRCQDGWTLAHFAAKYAPEMMRGLKKEGLDISSADANGNTPAHIEISRMRNALGEGVRLFQELADLSARLDVPNNFKQTPAHLACYLLNEQLQVNVTLVLSVIKSSGSNLSAVDSFGRTPAHYCAVGRDTTGNPRALEFLHDVVPEAFLVRDRDGERPEDRAKTAMSTGEIFFAKLKAQKAGEETSKYAAEVVLEKERAQDTAHETLRQAKRCTQFGEEVNAVFDCVARKIEIPEGFTIMSHAPFCDAECAVKCPNPKACPKKSYDNQRCSVGYDDESVGCAGCAADYGRNNQDPFVCGKCRAAWQMWSAQLLKPIVIYVMSIRAAKPNRDLHSSLLKMLLAFGTVSASLWSCVKHCDAYQTLLPLIKSAANIGDASVSMTTQWHGPSMDCLLGVPHAPMAHWLLLTVMMPMILLVASFAVSFFRFCYGHQLNLLLSQDFFKHCLVLTNCFLPDFLGALVRFVPCIHFQQSDAAAISSFASYNVTSMCQWTAYRYSAFVCIVLLGAAVGPFLWTRLISKSSSWTGEERKDILGFLVSGYRQEVQWWEATVLTRKCLLVMLTTLFPTSYSPLLFLASLLAVMGVFLMLHTLARPYEDGFLNNLELGILMASTVGVLCALLLELQPVTWSLDYSVTYPVLAFLFLLLLVPFVMLLTLVSRESMKKVQQFQNEPSAT